MFYPRGNQTRGAGVLTMKATLNSQRKYNWLKDYLRCVRLHSIEGYIKMDFKPLFLCRWKSIIVISMDYATQKTSATRWLCNLVLIDILREKILCWHRDSNQLHSNLCLLSKAFSALQRYATLWFTYSSELPELRKCVPLTAIEVSWTQS